MKARERILKLLTYSHPRSVSGGEIAQICGLWAGTLYIALYGLERNGVLESHWDEMAGAVPRRRMYRLKQPITNIDWMNEDPGTCARCGTSYELVRPGKSQPTCDCYN